MASRSCSLAPFHRLRFSEIARCHVRSGVRNVYACEQERLDDHPQNAKRIHAYEALWSLTTTWLSQLMEDIGHLLPLSTCCPPHSDAGTRLDCLCSSCACTVQGVKKAVGSYLAGEISPSRYRGAVSRTLWLLEHVESCGSTALR